MRKLTLLLVSLLFVGAQMLQAQRTITGTVVSAEDNQGIPGVTVQVRGTTTGTTTNVMGQYTLNVSGDATHLVFSFMGMATQEVPIDGRTTIDVVMGAGATALEGVVVTALGIARSERSVGFATSNVGGEDLVQRSEPDALRALEGRIPGVDISATGGAAGSSTRITIRGNSSFSSTGNNQPLFVVDGIPFSNTTPGSGIDQNRYGGGAYGNSFNTLDPNDIESMQVLKGAAAAALYGSRAANGVILITTKSGSRTRRPSQKGTEITVGTSWAWETISSLPDFQNTYGSGVQFRDLMHEDNSSWGPRFDRVDSVQAWPLYRAAYPELFPNNRMAYTAQPDNVKDLFRTGFMQDYSFNVSSRSDKGVFNVTASRMHQDGYIPNSHFTRTSISVGGNNTLDNKFKVGGNISFSNTDQLGSTFGSNSVNSAYTTSSFSRVFFLGRNWDVHLPIADRNGLPLNWTNTRTGFDNPLWEWENNTHGTKMNRVVSQANIGYDIFDWLSVSYQVGYNMNATDRTSVTNIGSRAHSGLGSIYRTNIQSSEIESNLMLTITRMLTRDISLQAVVGQNVNQRDYRQMESGGWEFLVPGVFTAGNVANPDGNYSYTSKRRLSAVYADVALGYKNYLYLNLTGRNDWSSTLPKANNNYFYPAITGSFVATDAFPQIKNDYLSNVRLRAGWAKVGNDAGVYYDYEGINVGFGVPFRGQTRMAVPTTSVDPNLMPEFTSEVEFGGNIGLLKNRLIVDLTWYDRRSEGQIAAVTVPQSTGYSSFTTNFGEVQNTGIELAVEGTVISNRHVEWNLGWNFTQNKNTVISLTEGLERIVWGLGVLGWPEQVLEPGKPYGYIMGTNFYRDEDGSLLVNLDGTLRNTNIPKQIGDPNPKYITSILSTVKSHGFTLGIVFDYQKGGDIYSTFLSELLARGTTKFNEDREGGRIIPGYYADPNDASKPLLDANGNRIKNTTMITERAYWFGGNPTFGVNTVAEPSIFDATTFRLREITLGYTVPRQYLAKLPIGSLDISFSARNLWFYSPNIPKHLNMDPIMTSIGADSNIRGVQMNAAPSTRRFGVNLRFTF